MIDTFESYAMNNESLHAYYNYFFALGLDPDVMNNPTPDLCNHAAHYVQSKHISTTQRTQYMDIAQLITLARIAFFNGTLYGEKEFENYVDNEAVSDAVGWEYLHYSNEEIEAYVFLTTYRLAQITNNDHLVDQKLLALTNQFTFMNTIRDYKTQHRLTTPHAEGGRVQHGIGLLENELIYK